MFQQAIDAVFENGTFRPLAPEAVSVAEGQQVRLVIEDQSLPEPLRLATQVYEGLTDGEIDEIERIALDRTIFFGNKVPGP